MGRRPDMDGFIPPDVAMFGNRFARKWQQSVKTYRTYAMWWRLFYTAATTCFKWEGMPKEIDTRFLERILFLSGSAAITKRAPKSEKLPLWVAARFSQQGNPDIYNNPNTIRLQFPNGTHDLKRHLNVWVRTTGNQYGSTAKIMDADAVAIWDNLQRMPLYNEIDLICARLAEFDLTIDQNMRAMRVPYIINVAEEGKKNAEVMFNKVDAGEPALYLSPLSSGVVSLQVFNSGIDYNIDKMLNDELKLVSQAYTLLGIDNNAAAEKKERVQTAETLANNEQFMVQRQSRYLARVQAADRARELFGLDLKPMWSVPHVPMQAEGDSVSLLQGEGLRPYSMRTASNLSLGSNTTGEVSGSANTI